MLNVNTKERKSDHENKSFETSMVDFAISLSKLYDKETGKYDTEYENSLQENSSQIIDNLGGLHNVIQLCMTNPKVENIVTPQNFRTIKKCINREENHVLNCGNSEIILNLDSEKIESVNNDGM